MEAKPVEIKGLTRRFAQISIPGQTAPLGSISIPVPPANAPTSGNTGQTYPSLTTKIQQQKIRAKARMREQSLILSEIESIEFSLYSTEEIDQLAVVNITSSDFYGPSSVRSLKMGPYNESQICETCSNDIRGCPGHFGKIVIPRLMHPLAIDTIILVLSSVCNSCGSLLMSKKEIEKSGISRMKGKLRLQAIANFVKTHKLECPGDKTPKGAKKCEIQPVYASYRTFSKDRFEYRLLYGYSQSKQKPEFFLEPDLPPDSPGNSIYKILNAISDEDAQLLGFRDSHPRNMIIDRLLVVPYCARPDYYLGDKPAPDDLTVMYQDIAKRAHNYFAATSPVEKDNEIRELFFRVVRLMENDGKYTQGGVKVYIDIKNRIQGKNAIIRANIMGKRVNFAGRTVVGPGANLRVDQVGIPRLMANKLTRPIRVTEYNKEELQAKYDNNRVLHITMQSGPLAGQRTMINEVFRKKFPNYQLNEGDLVERILEDGDIVLINRQPTLHKQSILACYAKIIDDRIVRINLSVTTPLNADFDGDEINIHVPQTIESYVEAEQLVAIHRNLMSAEANKPALAIVYDTLSGAYLMTRPEHELEQLEREIQKLEEILKKTDDPQIRASLNAALARRDQVKEKILIDPVVYNIAIIPVVDSPQYITLYQRLAKYNIDPRSGRGLISATFPEDFDYYHNDGKGNEVIIKEGVLIKGVLNKNVLGNTDGSIISEMYKQLGGLTTVDFMSDIQFVVREFLTQHGLSIGVDDCIPEDPNFRQVIEEALTNASMKVISLSSGPAENQVMEERKERKILNILENAKSGTEEVLLKYMKPDNALLIMAGSGAKGSVLNAVQIASALGQQKVSGKRIEANLSGGRALPVFEPRDPDPKARGFCFNSFVTGLEPAEFFFHAQGGREGLTDTANGTARTGSLQHQIIKSAEDIHISTDGSVRTPDLGIIEFVYGGDGFQPNELGSVKVRGEAVHFFRNIQQLANKINRKYHAKI